ncbi:rhodanese-like domain-containing protein [Vibrio sp. AK197]|uniref:Rhodanese-like domain-containing protein n=1 Tax=Vibrio olivae TaxID=1243002 RepID=A0ABV5HQS8_9VIBR
MQEYVEFFQQNMILCLVWVGVFIALLVSIFKSSTAAYKQISAAQVTQLMNRENGVVVDIRTKDEFRKGHITDAVHILPSDIKQGNLGSLESHKSDPIIVVCKTGQTAQESANLLAKAGFENVNLLKNGLVAWSEANLPLVTGKK